MAVPEQLGRMEEARRSLSRIGEGLTSCLDIPELQHLRSLRSLCLHGNNIGGIEGLEQLSALQDLNLSSNCISSVTNLGSLTSLTSLNLASNKLVHLQGLEPLPNLVQLNLSYNALTSLAGLAVLAGPSSKLRVLDVRQNAVPSLQAFAVLAGCVSLRDLSIAGNPACAAPNHRHTLLQALPQVAKLDGVSSADVLVSPPDVASAQLYAAERLQTFDQQVAGRQQHMLSPQRQPQQAQQQGGSGRTPRIDASLAVYQPGKQQMRDDAGKGPSPAHSPWHQPDGAGSLPTEQRWERQQQQTQSHLQGSARQGLNWQQQSHQQQHGGMTGSSRRQQQHAESSWPAGSVGMAGTRGSTGHMEGSDTRQRIYVVDAATQTAEHMSIQARLQAEADLLRQQLVQLTGEESRWEGRWYLAGFGALV